MGIVCTIVGCGGITSEYSYSKRGNFFLGFFGRSWNGPCRFNGKQLVKKDIGIGGDGKLILAD